MPYVIADGRAQWELLYRNVRIVDFLATHRIRDGKIYINYGATQAGGPNLHDIATMWQQFYQLVQSIDPIISVGAAAIGTGVAIRQRLKKRNWPPKGLQAVDPGSAFSLVVSRKQWNAIELASIMQISEDDAKNLLRLCRYKWDRKRMLYVQTPETESVVSRLNDADWISRS